MTENRVVILTRGISGSGKSTWARAQQIAEPGRYKIVEKDLLRFLMDGEVYTHQDEEFFIKACHLLILHTLEAGFDVIVSNTNLDPSHEAGIRELVVGKAEVYIQDFTDVSLDFCLARNRQRDYPNRVADERIIWQYRHYILQEKEEANYAEMASQGVRT